MRLLILFLLLSLGLTYENLAQQGLPVNIIFDTDMGPDYDDVGALAVLHALADKGEANILATVASTRYEGVASVLDIINRYFKRPDVPIGVGGSYALDMRDWQYWSDSLRATYPHSIKTNDEAFDAVGLYRKILAAQPDESVVVVTVGFLSNLAALLKSGPDEYSPLNGKDLIAEKVKHLVSMAGKFPEGMEFNIEEDAEAAVFVFENWPGTVVYSGFEIGEKIKTGIPLVNNEKLENSPIKDVYRIAIPMAESDRDGRMSWDQTAVLVAVRGPEPYYELVEGQIILQANGYNNWNYQNGSHFHLKEKMPVNEAERLINELMMHQPSQ
jgi:inosine-uridine nucleoside N-ribohydrolase